MLAASKYMQKIRLARQRKVAKLYRTVNVLTTSRKYLSSQHQISFVVPDNYNFFILHEVETQQLSFVFVSATYSFIFFMRTSALVDFTVSSDRAVLYFTFVQKSDIFNLSLAYFIKILKVTQRIFYSTVQTSGRLFR